ncbi:MAG TPA: Tad domain-containing protein, partial [Anaerolineales bacterium]
MLDTYTQEKGQALVLITLAMVVLLGFTALAIDGGMVYSDRRHAQNAADASSLAGGSAAALQLENDHITYGTWGCNKGDILDAMDAGEGAAIDRAGDNGFSIDANITD